MAERELKLEIAEIKEEVQDISAKVDQVIQILVDFTNMFLEDTENNSDIIEESEEFDYEDSWVPDEDEFWNNQDN